MPAFGEFFLGPVSTSMAVLACERRVDRVYLTTGTFSLVGKYGAELAPCGITDALGETMVLDHTFDVQLFNGNDAEAIDQTTGILMTKIMAAVSDTLVDTGENLVGFTPFTASLLGLGLFPASLC
jgi:hypothetical protein